MRDGEKVLFIGLPCQVASLLNVTGNNPNLYTVDLLCHGTPSRKVLQAFFNTYKVELKNIKNISFRSSKGYGIEEDGRTFASYGLKDYYTTFFTECTSLTENCYFCHYASSERISDITIGDR